MIFVCFTFISYFIGTNRSIDLVFEHLVYWFLLVAILENNVNYNKTHVKNFKKNNQIHSEAGEYLINMVGRVWNK